MQLSKVQNISAIYFSQASILLNGQLQINSSDILSRNESINNGDKYNVSIDSCIDAMYITVSAERIFDDMENAASNLTNSTNNSSLAINSVLKHQTMQISSLFTLFINSSGSGNSLMQYFANRAMFRFIF